MFSFNCYYKEHRDVGQLMAFNQIMQEFFQEKFNEKELRVLAEKDQIWPNNIFNLTIS